MLVLVDEVFPVDLEAVECARTIVLGSRRLSARDALHVAVMEGQGIRRRAPRRPAEHFANDLGKDEARGFPRRFKVMSLTSNVSLLTAWASDTDYEHVFAEQLRNFGGRGEHLYRGVVHTLRMRRS